MRVICLGSLAMRESSVLGDLFCSYLMRAVGELAAPGYHRCVQLLLFTVVWFNGCLPYACDCEREWV